jgi:hypothetical protein
VTRKPGSAVGRPAHLAVLEADGAWLCVAGGGRLPDPDGCLDVDLDECPAMAGALVRRWACRSTALPLYRLTRVATGESAGGTPGPAAGSGQAVKRR